MSFLPKNDIRAFFSSAGSIDDAVKEFDGTEVEITTSGRRYLGGCLGSMEYANEDLAVRVAE